MWAKIKGWLTGVAAKLFPVLEAYAATAGAQFVAAMWPTALKLVEKAAGMDLDGDGKFAWTKTQLETEARNAGIAFKDSQIKQAIELALEVAKDKGLVPTTKTP